MDGARPKIVLSAAPYCYGPTSKLLCIASGLKHGADLTYIGTEPGLSLARAAGLDRVVPLTKDERWSESAMAAVANADVLVSALDSWAVKAAANCRVPSIFVDTLLWTRASVPSGAELAFSYVSQAFFRPPSPAVANKIPHLTTVGPIFSEALERAQPQTQRQNFLLVCFGGLVSPAMLPDADAAFVRFTALALARACVGRPLVFCLPHHLSGMVDWLTATVTNATVCSPGMETFHRLLSTCAACITTPGLEVVLEALHLATPLVFLPPHNGTQVLQETEYRNLSVGATSPLPYGRPDASATGMDLNALTRRIQGFNAVLFQNAAFCEQASDFLAQTLETAVWPLRERVCVPNPIDQLGRSGRIAVTKVIEAAMNEQVIRK